VDVWVSQQRMVLRSLDGVAMASSAPPNPRPAAPPTRAGAPHQIAPKQESPARVTAAPEHETVDKRPPPLPSVAPSRPAVAARPAVAKSAALKRPVPPAATPLASKPPEPQATKPPAPEPPEKKVSEKKEPAPWDLAKRGHYAQALQAAEARGWDKVIASARANQLTLLATAARVQDRSPLAMKLNKMIRLRFKGTAQAADAAYFLGSITVHKYADQDAAAVWFARYLAERPGGALSRAALGRLVECLYRSGKRGKACAAGRRYRVSYPDGPHMRFVRRILLGCGDAGAEKSR
jgi:hypothetical protein